MPARKPKLRIHLIGQSDQDKLALAKSLRMAMNKSEGRTDFTIVPPLSDSISGQFNSENMDYLLALENAYYKFETTDGKADKHLIFIDSIVDRYIRAARLELPVDVYFVPKITYLVGRKDSVFLYGPSYDAQRSTVISQFDIPVNVWSSINCNIELVEVLCLNLGKSHGRDSE